MVASSPKTPFKSQGTRSPQALKRFFRKQDKALRKMGLNPSTMKQRDKGVTKERRRKPPRPFQRTRTF